MIEYDGEKLQIIIIVFSLSGLKLSKSSNTFTISSRNALTLNYVDINEKDKNCSKNVQSPSNLSVENSF